jgi:hypothetical protein
MTMMTNTFRQIRALCRTMRKATWEKGPNVHNTLQCIRTPDEHCPLTFTALVATGKDLELQQFRNAGALLGITARLSTRIADAADKNLIWGDNTFVLKLRRILLKAAGLPPD